MKRRGVRRGPMVAVAVVGGLALLAGCGGPGRGDRTSSTSAAFASRPPSEILSEALAAARAAGAAHIDLQAKAGPSIATYSQDSTMNAGTQVITANGGGRATVLVVHGVGYIKANAPALAGFMGFAPVLAKRNADQWISFHNTDSGYQHVVSGVTLEAIIRQITLTGTILSTGVRAIGGQSVVGLRGGVPTGWGIPPGVKATLYVAATGRRLPVSFQASVGGGAGGESLSFSRWGEPVNLTAPGNAVPVSSVAPG